MRKAKDVRTLVPAQMLRHTLAMSFVVVGSMFVAACLNPVGKALYQPQPLAAASPAWAGRAPVPVTARTADGLDLAGWYWAPKGKAQDILVFLPGRAGNRDTAARQAEAFAEGGRGVLVASYRGYGSNAGTPDEQGLYRDGLAFADLARRLQPTGRLYLFGDGLGAAVALRAAVRGDVTGTATLGAFDRFSSFAPASTRGFYADAFDNMKAIRLVKTPVLILHGRKDPVVPFAAAGRLKQAAGGTAIVAPIDGEAYHTVDLRYVASTVWRAFDQMATMTVGTPASK
jgi:fermentation-respiration switch protein FrsA (DUF1100 family)